MTHERTTETIPHTPVMLKEVIHYLCPQMGKTYLDGTFGAGGYSRAILLTDGTKVIAVDRDSSVSKYATDLQEQYSGRFQLNIDSFSNIKSLLHGQTVDGVVLDLGVSSMQLDEGERGFSFMKDGPLDMRMSNAGPSAADFINNASEQEIADVIFNYGDETQSRKIAKFIVHERAQAPITTTARLASIVHKAIGSRRGKIDSATKTFQAIRIHVNDEIGELSKLLDVVADVLNIGGIVVVVTFHSIEDRVVKKYLQGASEKKIAISKYAKVQHPQDAVYKLLTTKVVIRSDQEIKKNPRARSAKLRAAIKVRSL
jgi:16S rRNA (cytosine1402-N4)-methyltransferase